MVTSFNDLLQHGKRIQTVYYDLKKKCASSSTILVKFYLILPSPILPMFYPSFPLFREHTFSSLRKVTYGMLFFWEASFWVRLYPSIFFSYNSQLFMSSSNRFSLFDIDTSVNISLIFLSYTLLFSFRALTTIKEVFYLFV